MQSRVRVVESFFVIWYWQSSYAVSSCHSVGSVGSVVLVLTGVGSSIVAHTGVGTCAGVSDVSIACWWSKWSCQWMEA